MRSISRVCDVSINTVTKLLVDVGTACDLYQHEHLRNLPCKGVQVDEIWTFCGMKEKNVPEAHKGELGYGGIYTWVAIDNPRHAVRGCGPRLDFRRNCQLCKLKVCKVLINN